MGLDAEKQWQQEQEKLFNMSPEAPYEPLLLRKLTVPMPMAYPLSNEAPEATNAAQTASIEDLDKKFNKQFQNISPNPFTTRWKSKDNRTLLVYIATQHTSPATERLIHEQPTMEELWAMQQDQIEIKENGIRVSGQSFMHPVNLTFLSRTFFLHWLDTQALMAVNQSNLYKVNIYYHWSGEDPTRQWTYYFIHYGSDGTLPIVEAWPQMGHPHEAMTPSTSHSTQATSPMAVQEWITATRYSNTLLIVHVIMSTRQLQV
ncbi:hypothetical protein K435DRAFT_868525 [Dendrothele bispora CBS 962.96]|uniref:Uncharacterized protein n=1 Tax=Dendrothele bispora (strain CBS 962.96) TaxID=1314807 RepID=A0A4S8LBH4_DENBC|nr:hypothetical protein K435DRAFT_868525 [Dendrothele bispora CBS 962.96]